MMDYVSVVYVSACDREHFGLFCPEQSIPTDVSIPMTFSVNTKACYWLLGAVSHDMAEMCWFKSCTVSCTAASLCWLTLFWHTITANKSNNKKNQRCRCVHRSSGFITSNKRSESFIAACGLLLRRWSFFYFTDDPVTTCSRNLLAVSVSEMSPDIFRSLKICIKGLIQV